MLRLYTTYYAEKNEDRLSELNQALENNLNSGLFDEIVIFNEGGDLKLFDDTRIICRNVENRPTYQDFFSYINSISSVEDIHIIANTDIIFDKQIGVLKELDWHNSCMALSRWEFTKNGKTRLYNHNDSQDTWIFKGRIKNVFGEFSIGIPRCDNRVLYELRKAGYTVINPSFNIKTYHHHKGERAPYCNENIENFVDPPYEYLYPHNIYGFMKSLWFCRKYEIEPYRYDAKKINRWLIYRILRKIWSLFFQKGFPLVGYRQ